MRKGKSAAHQNANTNERSVIVEHGLTVDAGDLTYLDGRLYITHSGLLKVARRNRCSGIHTELIAEHSNAVERQWVVKAVVYKTSRSKGFEGYGDANPANVSSVVRGAELRVAETRAVNRALRKAYGIGLCSVEEVGCSQQLRRGSGDTQVPTDVSAHHGERASSLSLRDHLALIIRRHHLDADQVKRYALSFLGVSELRESSRDQVAAFVEHLRGRAEHDYSTLLADLAVAGPKPPGSAVSATSDGHVVA